MKSYATYIILVIVFLVFLTKCKSTDPYCKDEATLVTLNKEISTELDTQKQIQQQASVTTDPIVIQQLIVELQSSLAKEQGYERERDALKASSTCLK